MFSASAPRPRFSFNFYQYLTFILTFLSYSAFHAARKAFTNAKSELNEQWNLTTKQLGLLDTAFMFTYAISLYAAGYLGSKYSTPKRILLIGSLGASACVLVFGQASNGNYADNYSLLCFLMILNGFFQSCAWPMCVTIIANWYGSGHRGVTFAIWTSNAPLGNILGSLLVAAAVKYGLEIAWDFTLPAILLLTLVCVEAFCLFSSPREAGFTGTSENSEELELMENNQFDSSANNDLLNSGETNPLDLNNLDGSSSDSRRSSIASISPLDIPSGSPPQKPLSTPHRRHPIQDELYTDTTIDHNNTLNDSTSTTASNDSHYERHNSPVLESTESNRPAIIQAILIPGVIPYSLAFACIKCVSYSLFFWLPYYLHNGLHMTSEMGDVLSIVFDIGQILGSLIAGVLSDKFRSRAIVSVGLLVLSSICIALFLIPTHNEYTISIVNLFTGICLGGPTNLINSAVAADLGSSTKNPRMIPIVSGIVDGTGSIGAAAGGYLVAYISESSSWSVVFIFWIVAIVVSILLLGPIFLKEIRIFLDERALPNRRSLVESNSEKIIHNDKTMHNGNFTRLHQNSSSGRNGIDSQGKFLLINQNEPVNKMEKLAKIEENDSGLLMED